MLYKHNLVNYIYKTLSNQTGVTDMEFYNFATTSDFRDYHYDSEAESFVLRVGDGDIVIRVDAHLYAHEVDVIIDSVLGA